MTHPSLGGSTSAGAAPLRTLPPRWVCAGRCLHRASRNNCSPACTCRRSVAPYSRPADREQTVYLSFTFHENDPLKQFKFSTPGIISAGRPKDLRGYFCSPGTKSLACIILSRLRGCLFIYPLRRAAEMEIMIFPSIWSILWLCLSRFAQAEAHLYLIQ